MKKTIVIRYLSAFLILETFVLSAKHKIFNGENCQTENTIPLVNCEQQSKIMTLFGPNKSQQSTVIEWTVGLLLEPLLFRHDV